MSIVQVEDINRYIIADVCELTGETYKGEKYPHS